MNRVVSFQGHQYKVPMQFKFLARDSNGDIYAYMNKPERQSTFGDYMEYAYHDRLKGNCLKIGNSEILEIED